MSSFFTIPYIAFLGLILLLISGVYIFLVKKMANQNHQFSSIVGVVTSLADELNRLKEFISTTLINKPKEIQLSRNELIHVSDDDETATEDETDTEYDSDSDSVESCDSHKSNEIASILDISSSNDIKYIQMIPKIENNNKLISLDVPELSFDSFQENDISLENIQEPNTSLENIQEPNTSLENIQENNISLDTIQSVEETEIDYKKLPLNKLRTIIVEKGLVDDASKLKKQALLQLLEQNNLEI